MGYADGAYRITVSVPNTDLWSAPGLALSVARLFAVQEGIAETGYRLIVNTGPHSGQVVFHIHMHVIGGQRMRYPMG